LAAAEQVLARMEQSRLAPPDQVTFNTLLKACANAAAARSAAGAAAVGGFVEALDKATAYVAAMKARGIDPDVYTYNTLLQVCSHVPPTPWRRTSDDDDTVDDITAAEEAVASVAARVDKVVEEVMREMNERGVRPDGATVTLLISHFGAREDPDRAFALLSDMKRANIKPYLPSFTALITACRHYSDPAMAEVRVVRVRMRVRAGVRVRLCVSLCVGRVCVCVQQMALTALDELKTAGFTPTSAVMNAFMAATPQRAPQVLAMMRDHNIEPTALTWNQLIYSVAWRLKSESAKNESFGNENESSWRGRELELLEEAFAGADRLQQSSRSGPASVAYGYLLEACLYASQRIHARRGSTTGTGADADEDISSGHAVLSAADKAALRRVAQLADRCWRDMLAHQPAAITREACAVRTRLCLRSASLLDPADAADARAGLQGAIEAYGETRRRGFRPNPLTYGALARACARHGAFERVTQLVEDMRAQGVQPSTDTLGATVQALASSPSPDAAAALAALRGLVLPERSA
jgi:pentatricopeptide repeat protein